MNKTTDPKAETHMVWPLFAVSSRDWTSSATFRSASLSTCSTCLTSASLPLIWPFTSSRLSMCLSPMSSFLLTQFVSICMHIVGPVVGLTECLTHLTLFPHTEKEPCSRTLWMLQSQWQMRKRPFPLCPTTPPGRKSSCMWPIVAGHHAPAESALPSSL